MNGSIFRIRAGFFFRETVVFMEPCQFFFKNKRSILWIRTSTYGGIGWNRFLASYYTKIRIRINTFSKNSDPQRYSLIESVLDKPWDFWNRIQNVRRKCLQYFFLMYLSTGTY